MIGTTIGFGLSGALQLASRRARKGEHTELLRIRGRFVEEFIADRNSDWYQVPYDTPIV
jgi:hypothetical protein